MTDLYSHVLSGKAFNERTFDDARAARHHLERLATHEMQSHPDRWPVDSTLFADRVGIDRGLAAIRDAMTHLAEVNCEDSREWLSLAVMAAWAGVHLADLDRREWPSALDSDSHWSDLQPPYSEHDVVASKEAARAKAREFFADWLDLEDSFLMGYAIFDPLLFEFPCVGAADLGF